MTLIFSESPVGSMQNDFLQGLNKSINGNTHNSMNRVSGM